MKALEIRFIEVFGESSKSFGFYNGDLDFKVRDRSEDNEPWKTDATADGTIIIKK